MNTNTTTTCNEILSLASVTCEELDPSYAAWLEELNQQQEELICDPHGDDMSEYADAIHRGFNEMPVSETTELWCEPGRALVAESSSILARVDLRKGDALYLNDGSYGSSQRSTARC
jgi:diaminopimelate decarboxylase